MSREILSSGPTSAGASVRAATVAARSPAASVSARSRVAGLGGRGRARPLEAALGLALACGVLAGGWGCSRSGDDDREEAIEAYLLEEAPHVIEAASEAFAKAPAAAALLALYAPSTSTIDADSIHALGFADVNRSGVSGVMVAGPSEGGFTLTLVAGNTLAPELTGTIRVTYLDDADEPVTDPGAAGSVVALDVDLDLVGPGGMTIAGEVEVALPAGGVPVDAAEVVEVEADLALAFPEEGEGAGHDHGHEGEEGDEHGEEAHAPHILGIADLEIACTVAFAGDFVAETIPSGDGALAYTLEVPLGSRAEGGHVHEGGDEEGGEGPVAVIGVVTTFAFNDTTELPGLISGAGMAVEIVIEVEPIEAP